VIDVGSNSARMIVFRLREGEHLDVIEDARAPLRLARELGDDDELGSEAIDRAIEALNDFRSVAQGAGVRRILAIATSAVREASDGNVLVERAREHGIPLEVIDGDVEARLGFVGAVHDLPVVHGATMDVGGGTTEISRFRDRRLEGSWTLPLGSLRLADRFFEEDPPTDVELKDARKEVEAVLHEAGVPPIDEGDLIGIGGTVRNLAKIDRRRTGYPLPILHGYGLREDHVARIVDELARRSMRSRAKVRGLNPDRADSIVAGGLIVQTTMRLLGAKRLVVSSRGLREGLALGGPDVEVPDPSWVRTISIHTLAARFATWEPKGAARRGTLAGDLLAHLDPEAPSVVREMLGHAAVLLDVGRAIDYYDRFEHAAMILTSSDLAGFTHGSLGVCTAILRQAEDDSTLGPYGRLVPKDVRPAVLRAATVLALADELNRRIPTGDVASLSVRRVGNTVEIAVPVAAGWYPRGVERRFRHVFGAELSIAAQALVPSGAPRIEPD
jgi:exopolyphosphatase/guanosine-5'-triphosphate,3'-diphosphate pyrophosphatase